MNYADSLKVVNDGLGNVTHVEEIRKPKLKLLKNDKLLKLPDSSNIDCEKQIENKATGKRLIDVNDDSTLFTEKHREHSNESSVLMDDSESANTCELFTEKSTDDKKILNKLMLDAIYNLKDKDNCPSVKSLSESIGYNKNIVCAMKKEFEELEILKTDGTKTIILCDYKEALNKLELVQ